MAATFSSSSFYGKGVWAPEGPGSESSESASSPQPSPSMSSGEGNPQPNVHATQAGTMATIRGAGRAHGTGIATGGDLPGTIGAAGAGEAPPGAAPARTTAGGEAAGMLQQLVASLPQREAKTPKNMNLARTTTPAMARRRPVLRPLRHLSRHLLLQDSPDVRRLCRRRRSGRHRGQDQP